MASVVTGRDRDCLSCRLVSGCGLIGIGGYLGYHARRNPTTAGRITISSFSLGTYIILVFIFNPCIGYYKM